MTESNVMKAVTDKFRAAGLLPFIVPTKRQLFRIPKSFFLELVSNDASRLEALEDVIAATRSAMGHNGTHLVSIARALWDVAGVEPCRARRAESRGIETAAQFKVSLKSGKQKPLST
jgi:hypothetical protein